MSFYSDPKCSKCWALRIDPMFAGLRDDPRFRAFLDRLAEYKRQKRVEAQRAGAFEDYDRLIRSGVRQANKGL